MTDPNSRAARFLDLVTRPLEDSPGIRDEARGELMARLPSEEAATEAAAILADKKPPKPWLPAVITAISLLVLGSITAHQLVPILKEANSLSQLAGNTFNPRDTVGTETKQDLFVTARLDPDRLEVLKNLKALQCDHPGDPGLFEEYTICHIGIHKALPANYRATWRQIDPGNGVWLTHEAGLRASVAFGGIDSIGSPVTDEAAFAEALELFDQAAAAERFEFHAADLRSRRLAFLPESETLADEIRTLGFVLQQAEATLHRSADYLPALIAEQARRLVAGKDQHGLRNLISSWKRLSHGFGVQSSTLIDSVVALGFVAKTSEPLLQATKDLGMIADEKELHDVARLISSASAVFRPATDTKPMAYLSGGSGLSAWPPGLVADTAIFEPGRRVEYAAADRVFALGSVLVCLLLLTIAGIESLRRGRKVNGPADGLSPLFRASDAVWVIGLGWGAPAAWYWGMTRLTPLGGRDIGLFHYQTPPAALQALAGLLLILATLLQTLRWRSSLRLGFMGWSDSRPWIGWAVAGITALLIPAIGAVRWITTGDQKFLEAMTASCGIPFFWLVWQAAVLLLSPAAGALPGVLIARRSLLPLSSLAALLLACGPVLRGEERKWHPQDRIGRCDRDRGGDTFAELQAVDWIARLFEERFPVTP